MIIGHKASGYLVTADRNGNKVERETRQCVHCQATWVYQPGSKRRYGFCLKCHGVICGNPECQQCKGPFEKQVEAALKNPPSGYKSSGGLLVPV